MRNLLMWGLILVVALYLVVPLLFPQRTPQTVAPILRASTLELVDERNVVRARLGVKGSDVIELDLFDKDGINHVKLGAANKGSGLGSGYFLVAMEERIPPLVLLSKLMSKSLQGGGSEPPRSLPQGSC